MSAKNYKREKGFSLAEEMVAMTILAITTLGAMGYRYHSAVDAHKADIQNSGARVASLLLENWKGVGSGSGYDPVAILGSELTITTLATGPAAPSGFITLGSYQIKSNQSNYAATLSYANATATRPRQLNVCVLWQRSNQLAVAVSSNVQSVSLSTCAD